MRNIYFLIILLFIFILQKYPIINAQHEALARLWNVPDNEIDDLIDRELDLMDADLIVKQNLVDEEYSGSYIRTTDNNVVFYTTTETEVNEIRNLSDVIPINHLLTFERSVNNLSLFDLKTRYKNLTRLALQYNPELVAIFIDVTFNNIVIASYHGFDEPNREFIDEVNRQFVNPAPVFEYGNLPNTNEQHKLNAINRRIIQTLIENGDGLCNLNQDVTCSIGFWARRNETNENVIVTSGRCYRFEQEYFLKPWGSLNIYNYIGRMSRISSHHKTDVGIVSIEGNVRPTRIIRNTDSPMYPRINTYGKTTRENDYLGIHSCKSGYFTHLTCGYLRSNEAIYFDAIDPYKISYVINIENHIYDIGGPVFTFFESDKAHLTGILTGGIGNIGFATDIDSILMRGD
ncbi:hypothetical protein F8M41_022741 [Gigaspora margarita]|uniref:Uncharacterized protein n=1 Tax=Gigaspora margarita TaxID=4874 RepID=A0A8H4AEM1_GIGMA|nr:hypothetical protein F8M41_022741 [Gigaspora margarita]